MGPIDEYLAQLRVALKVNPLLARRVLEEVSDHLALIADEERRSGMSDHEAEEKAVRRFGPPDQFARRFDRFALPFRLFLLFASISTAVVGLWLLFVIAVVLPAHDPAHIPLWRGITAGFFAYCGLTWTYLIRGPRSAWLRGIVLVASVAAIAAGLYGIVNMINVARSGGHFEGYIIFMGLILCAHGLFAVIYAVLSRHITRSVAA